MQKANIMVGGHQKAIFIDWHVLSHQACNNVHILHLVLWHDLYMVYLYCIFWKKKIYIYIFKGVALSMTFLTYVSSQT